MAVIRPCRDANGQVAISVKTEEVLVAGQAKSAGTAVRVPNSSECTEKATTQQLAVSFIQPVSCGHGGQGGGNGQRRTRRANFTGNFANSTRRPIRFSRPRMTLVRKTSAFGSILLHLVRQTSQSAAKGPSLETLHSESPAPATAVTIGDHGNPSLPPKATLI